MISGPVVTVASSSAAMPCGVITSAPWSIVAVTRLSPPAVSASVRLVTVIATVVARLLKADAPGQRLAEDPERDVGAGDLERVRGDRRSSCALADVLNETENVPPTVTPGTLTVTVAVIDPSKPSLRELKLPEPSLTTTTFEPPAEIVIPAFATADRDRPRVVGERHVRGQREPAQRDLDPLRGQLQELTGRHRQRLRLAGQRVALVDRARRGVERHRGGRRRDARSAAELDRHAARDLARRAGRGDQHRRGAAGDADAHPAVGPAGAAVRAEADADVAGGDQDHRAAVRGRLREPEVAGDRLAQHRDRGGRAGPAASPARTRSRPSSRRC